MSKIELFAKEAKVLKDIRTFKTGFAIPFSTPITLLVGDNGCGKSTFLDMMREFYGIKDTTYLKQDAQGYMEVSGDNKPKVMYFDFHGMDMKFGGTFGPDMGAQIVAQRASSGQGLAYQLKSSGILSAKNSLLIMDEIGRGFSLRLQYVMTNLLEALAFKAQNQIVASTHSYRTMMLADNPNLCRLYSIEHRKFMGAEEFLEAHLKGVME